MNKKTELTSKRDWVFEKRYNKMKEHSIPKSVIARTGKAKQLSVSEDVHKLLKEQKKELQFASFGQVMWYWYVGHNRSLVIQEKYEKAEEGRKQLIMSLGTIKANPPSSDLLFSKRDMYDALNLVTPQMIHDILARDKDWKHNSTQLEAIIHLVTIQTLKEASKYLEDLFHNGTG